MTVVEAPSSETGREQLTLDPSEVATGRYELDITGWVGEQGPDWGDAEIAAAVAEMQRGEVPVDFRIPNRKITIPLLLLDRETMTFTEIRKAIQQKVGLFQREGGWIKRDTVAGPLYADIVNASLKLGGSSMQAMHGIDTDAVLTLETLPDWYEDEQELDVMTAVDGDIIGVLQQGGDDAEIGGDSPARCRIELTNSDALDRDLLPWAFRARYYDAAATAALMYEAEDLVDLPGAFLSPGASIVTVAGASGGSVIEQDVDDDWTAIFSSTLTHTGSYRVWARLKSDGPDAVFRMQWRTSDGLYTTNTYVTLEGVDTFEFVDLGAVRVDPAVVGTHEWDLTIYGASELATASVDPDTVGVDKLWLQPLDETAGELRDTTTVLPASRHAQLRTEGMFRESTATAGVYAPMSHVLGDLPRLPPSGLEQRPVELFLVVDGDPTADYTAQVFYRPSWLFAPGG